jgi:hypothetical protein
MRCVPIFVLTALSATVFAQTPRFRQVTIPTGPSPRWITVADVNHDNHSDIVVANAGTDSADNGTTMVLLGDGSGAFHPAPGSPFAAGHLPNDIAIADMNGDSHPDLIVANHQSPYLRVFLGDGRGGFHLAPGSPVDVRSNPHPHGVVVGDFTSDGKPDAVTDSWANNQIELLRGDGTGRLLTRGTFFATGRRPYERLRTADFNRDGHPDIVTTNLDDGTVSILLGDGKGTLQNAPGSPFPTGAKPWQLAIDDLNNDNIADLITIPYQRDIAGPSENVVTILLGDGRGGFHPMPGPPLPLGDCRGANSIAAGDLSGHGSHAIVINCAESKTLLLFERDPVDPEARFTASTLPTLGGWGSVAIARLTSDPRSAIITANANAGSITIWFPAH